MRTHVRAVPVVLAVLSYAQTAWACNAHQSGGANHGHSITTQPGRRDLRGRHGRKQKVFPVCGTESPTKREVTKSTRAVADFYRQVEKNNDWKRRLQAGPININVNFVVVSDSNGTGNVTQAVINDQMAVLNAAFRPDFNFSLISTQYVSNDTYFAFESTFPEPSGAEVELKTRYRRGGTETLNVYSLEPIYPDPEDPSDPPTLLGYAYFPYPFLNGGIVDGVVVHHETLPGGAFIDFSEGAVSENLSLCFACSFWLTFHVSCVDIAA
jgi:hypothetical protein